LNAVDEVRLPTGNGHSALPDLSAELSAVDLKETEAEKHGIGKLPGSQCAVRASERRTTFRGKRVPRDRAQCCSVGFEYLDALRGQFGRQSAPIHLTNDRQGKVRSWQEKMGFLRLAER
jgi:hypothetical protein